MYLLCIYQKPIALTLFKTYTLNFTMYVWTYMNFTMNFTAPQKTIIFLSNCKEKAQNK